MKTLADAVGTGIEKCLPARPGIIPNPIAAATVFVCSIIYVTEPGGTFEMDPSQPNVLQLRKRVDTKKGVEILAVGKTAATVRAASTSTLRQIRAR